MVSMVIPQLEGYLSEVLEEKSIKIRRVTLPSKAKENQVDMISVYPKDWPSVLIVFGCCIMLLFEDINPQNYINLMSNRISEMRAKVGCDPGNPMEFPFSLEKAKAIRSMLGSSMKLKTQVITMIIVLAGKSESIGSLTNYLMDILSWSELREFTFIHDNLLLTKSPVLLDPRLKLELAHLNEAFKAICSHSIPQFFSYLGNYDDQYKLERSRFPIIMAVAEELRITLMRSLMIPIRTLSPQCLSVPLLKSWSPCIWIIWLTRGSLMLHKHI
ncbi:hypothetical protein L6164_032945 [Bauhinia variegata]|uniref:Uncharacterized protein n=1 Tax=Bauhinia variegata TaxID=167791 RepID=A0ACB9KQE4_BAUVA|nr:hypothetical protein L6164_032945 [Bauhinia variegata]